MQLHKTLLEDVEEDDFGLMALYGDLEDYKMAYLLNKYLKLQLKRERRDLDFNHKEVQAYYAHYSFKDLKNFRSYHLVANKFNGESKKVLSSGSLFKEEEVRPLQVNLVPEYKKVDFFLKIDEETSDPFIFCSLISVKPNFLLESQYSLKKFTSPVWLFPKTKSNPVTT